MNKNIMVGIIGFGNIGRVHYSAYKRIILGDKKSSYTPSIKAILRSQSDNQTEITNDFFNPLVTTDPAIFYNQHLDIVDICTPNYLHLSQAEGAISRQINVYCEKPLGINYVEANKMATLARNANVLTHTAFIFRYIPFIQLTKELVATNRVGKPLHFRITMSVGSYLNPSKPISWRLRKSKAVGVH